MGRKHRYPVAALRAQQRTLVKRRRDFLEPLFRYGSETKVILASPTFMRVFRNLSLRRLYKQQNAAMRLELLQRSAQLIDSFPIHASDSIMASYPR